MGSNDSFSRLFSDGEEDFGGVKKKSRLEEFAERYEQDNDILRFNYHKPEELLRRVRDLMGEHRLFRAADDFAPDLHFFITEEETEQEEKKPEPKPEMSIAEKVRAAQAAIPSEKKHGTDQ